MKRLLTPIKLVNGRFRVTDLDEVTEDGFQTALRRLVEQRYGRSDQYVECGGRIVHTSAFLSGDRTEGYAELDADGMPVNIDPPRAAPAGEVLTQYLTRLMWQLTRSDGMTTDTAVAVDSEFVEPGISWVDADTATAARWEDIGRQARLVLVGAPGSGKSVLARHLAHQCARAALRSADPTVPVYLRLRDLSPARLTDGEPASLLSQEDGPLHDILRGDNLPGQVLLVLDGLDEVPHDSTRRRILAFVSATCAVQPTIRVLLTTRATGYQERLPGFAHARIDPFGPEQVALWLRRFLTPRTGPAEWRTLLGLIAEEPGVAELATNPLLLSIIANAYTRTRTVGRRRADIYEGCAEALINGWDTVRGVRREPDAPDMARQMRSALAEMAFTAIFRHRTHFTTADLVRRSKEVTGFTSRPEEVLGACVSAGVLVEQAGQWTFVHRAFQEYLAATRLLDVVGTEAVHRQPSQIWELACGLARDASGLLEACITDVPTRLLQSAARLARAFGQDFTADRAVVGRAGVVIRAALERHANLMSEMPLAQLESSEAGWVVAVAPGRVGSELAATIEAIHKARFSTGGAILRQTLADCATPVIRQIAYAMLLDGGCQAVKGPADTFWLLYPSLPPLPPAAASDTTKKKTTKKGRKTIDVLVDDLDGADADQTVKFKLDGVQYEIDLSKRNAAKLRGAFEPYLGTDKVGQAVQGVTVGSPKSDGARERSRVAADRDQNRAIREWVAAKGIKATERGRLRQEDVDRFSNESSSL